MAPLSVGADEEKRVKGLGFLNNKGTDNFSARVITINGKINSAQCRCIAEAAEKFGNGNITFTSRMTVEVQGIPYEKIDAFRAFIAVEGLTTGGTGPLVRPIVSCKGTTCGHGKLDTFAISEEIHHRFYEGYRTVKLPHKFKIAVGGCPNNCVKPDLNDVGLIGQMVPTLDPEKCRGCKKCAASAACPVGAATVINGVLQIDRNLCINCGRCVSKCLFKAISGSTGIKITLGGRWGKKCAQGRPMSRIFTEKDEALNVVEKAILLFREQGLAGERFAETIDRIGFDKVEAMLLANDLLKRKDQIIADH